MSHIVHRVTLPHTLTATADMAQWCRDNGIPVVHFAKKSRMIRAWGHVHGYRGTRGMMARGQTLAELQGDGLTLGRGRPRTKKLVVLLRESDLFLFRMRYN